MKYKGYDIVESIRHGKACNGAKKTNSIQVRLDISTDGYLMLKSYSYPINDVEKKKKAIDKAVKFINKHINEKLQP